MNSPSNHRKQQQQQQQPNTRRVRATTTTAATLYDKMSHATDHTSTSTSPELPRTSPVPAVNTRNHNDSGIQLSSSPTTNTVLSPTLSFTRQTTTKTISRTVNTAAAAPSSAPLPSSNLCVANVNRARGASTVNPLFYIRPLSSAVAASVRNVRGVGQASTGNYGSAFNHHLVSNTNNYNNYNSTSMLVDPEVSNSGLGRSTPTSSTTSAALLTSLPAPASAFSTNATNSNNNNSSNSNAHNCSNPLSTPPSSIRSGALSSIPPTAGFTTAATAGGGAANGNNNTLPVYFRHAFASTSGSAPWLRLHRFCGGNNTGSTTMASSGSGTVGIGSPVLSSSAGSRKASGTTTSGTLAGASALIGVAAVTAAGNMAAGVPNAGTPKVSATLSTSTPGVPGTPLAALDLSHNPGSEDEAAARACQWCQSLNCVCGPVSGIGEGGFASLSSAFSGRRCSSSGSSSGVPWSTALTLQQQQQRVYPQTTAAAEAAALLSLVPPFRTARVEAGVYRGAYPVLRNFPYLRRLRLRTIVSLIPEPPTYDLKCFAEAEHIQLHHIHAERAKGEVQLLPSELSEALQLIMNADLHPLYVHCLDGRHVTGLVIMGVRKLQQWDIKAAHAEYLRFTREEQDEVSFIADYTGPLLVPPHIPSWLWGGSLYDPATGQPKKLQPSTMRLRLSTAVTGGVTLPSSSNISSGCASVARGFSGPANNNNAGADQMQHDSNGFFSAHTNSAASVRAAGGCGDARLHATAPWMSVPHAEVAAADGQRYVDVDRVCGSAAFYNGSNTGGGSVGYSNVPMLFSFEYAAAHHASPANGGVVASAVTSLHASARRGGCAGGSNCSSHHVYGNNDHTNPNSRHSSQSNSTNSSMAGPPMTISPTAISAVNTRNAPLSTNWFTTSPLDGLQPHLAPCHMQPPSPNASGVPANAFSNNNTSTGSAGSAGQTAVSTSQQRVSPTPSNSSNNANEVGLAAANPTASSSLFDSQLSALMWTSGLTTPPTSTSFRKDTVVASGFGDGRATGVGVGVSVISSVSSGGVGGGVSVAGAAAAASGARRSGRAGVNSADSNTSGHAAKRSYSR